MLDGKSIPFFVFLAAAAIAALIGGVARLMWSWEGETLVMWVTRRMLASITSGLLMFGLLYEGLAENHPVFLWTVALAAGILDGDLMIPLARRIVKPFLKGEENEPR